MCCIQLGSHTYFQIKIIPVTYWDIYLIRLLGPIVTNLINSNYFYKNTNFYWLFGKIWRSCFRNKPSFRRKYGKVTRERNNWPPRNKYMATWQDGTFDVIMTSSEVVCTHHHICGFLCRPLVLEIKPNTGQTLGTTNKREIWKKNLSLKGPHSYS